MSTLKSNEPENRCPECTGKMRIGSHESGGHDHLNQESHLQYIQICVGALLFVAGLFFGFEEPVKLALFIVAYVFIGGEVIINALKNLGQSFINKKLSFDENFLMSIASIGAFAIGEYPEGIAVMLFYRIGDIFQQLAVRRSRRSITELMDVRPDYTYLKTDDGIETVSPESVPVGSIIVVRPGEKIPLDGVIEKGRSALDVSALTGEFFPRSVDVGDEVLSGSINKTGLLTIKTTRTFGDSTVAKILDLVQNAVDKKSKTENFITRFARYYTPAVVLAAVIIAVFPPLLSANADFFDWLERALIFLVVSCPCALVISIPLSFFGGIGGASRNGILVKGGNCLEALTNVDTVVFDKTGTLTHGECKVAQIVPAEDFSRHELLRIAAIAESNSTHPIAVSICKAYGRKIDRADYTGQIEEIAGFGVKAQIEDKSVWVGSRKLMGGIERPDVSVSGTIVFVAIDGSYVGHIIIADKLKPDSAQTIRDLRNMGVKRIIMLTGDCEKISEEIAEQIELDCAYSELLPHEKVSKLEELAQDRTTNGKLVFVGDGINDAPVLARADVGIAMGALGSDAAIEAADIVLMTDEPSKVVTAIQIARKTRRIARQNIICALGTKAVILVLGALGIATMWGAVFGDVGVSIIAILNAVRAMRIQRR